MKRVLTILLLLCFAFAAQAQFSKSIAFKAASAKPTASAGSGLLVDSFQDFHTGNAGDLISDAIMQGSATGDTAWSTNTDGLGNPITTFTITNISAFTLRTPVVIGGTTITTTGTKALFQNTANGIARSVEEVGLITPGGIKNMEFGYFFYQNAFNTNGSEDVGSYDFSYLDDPAFVVHTHINYVGGDSVPHYREHFQMSNGVSSPTIAFDGTKGKWYWAETFAGADGFRSIKYYDPTNSYSLVAGMFGYGGPTNVDFAHPAFRANYIPTAGLTGIVAVAGAYINYSHVNTNKSPMFPNAPTSVTVTQSFDHEVTIRLNDSNEQLSPYAISNKVTGVVTTTGTTAGSVAWTNITDTSLVNGTAYSWDVYAVYPPSDNESAKVTVGPLTVAEIDVTNGLQGWWRLNGQYTDSSPNGNNGTPQNAPTTDVGVGNQRGYSTFFSSPSQQFVSLGDPTSLHIQPPMTLAAWIKCPPPTPDEMTIYGSGGDGIKATGTPWFITGAGDTLFLGSQFVSTIASGSARMPTNVWTHVAVTYDAGGNWKTYVNGILDASGTTAGVTTFTYGHPLDIARGPYDGGATQDFCTGNIQDFRIYNRALAGGEVSTIAGIPPQ